MGIVDNLKRLRKQTGETQDSFASKLDISRTTYANYEQGVAEPDASTLFKIAQYLGVTMDEIYTGVSKKGNLNSKNEQQENQQKGNLKGNRIGHPNAVFEDQSTNGLPQ